MYPYTGEKRTRGGGVLNCLWADQWAVGLSFVDASSGECFQQDAKFVECI